MSGTFPKFEFFAGKRLHLGVSGSVAAYKTCDLLRACLKAGLHVSAVLTDGACRFISPLLMESLGASPVYGRLFDGGEDPFSHLEPGQGAHAMLVAPATADVLSRLAAGAASDMLSAQALAFSGPLVVAPAMNPRMWQHPAVQANVQTLASRGVTLVGPGKGTAACGDTGCGRLADISEIYLAVLRALAPQDMAGKRVMVTLGPTREKWDGVRYWSNPSTGTMGAALAMAAWLRGAEVDAVCGPASAFLPASVRCHRVTSAAEMFECASDIWKSADIGIFTAAVADFSPEPFGEAKFSKGQAQDGFSVKFTPNRDILKTLAAERRPDQKVMGFAAETEADLPERVRRKLSVKKADIIVGNRVNTEGSGFGTSTDSVFVADSRGREENWPVRPKTDVAWDLCSWLCSL